MKRTNQGIRIGAGWISLMEPAEGYELAFHRWYADDHFYSGGMNLPGIFTGRRWVTTRRLQALRYPTGSSLVDPLSTGRFLHTNLFAEGSVPTAVSALGETISDLAAAGRMYVEEIPRRHIFSRIQPHAGTVYRDLDDGAPLDIHALDYPFDGLVLQVVDATGDRSELVEWLVEEFVPGAIAGSPAAMCLIFLDADLPSEIAAKTGRIPTRYGESAERRVSLVWLLDEDPAVEWASCFAGHGRQIAASGHGRIEFASAFIPTVPGADTHIDEL